jgi:hypothetical protein
MQQHNTSMLAAVPHRVQQHYFISLPIYPLSHQIIIAIQQGEQCPLAQSHVQNAYLKVCVNMCGAGLFIKSIRSKKNYCDKEITFVIIVKICRPKGCQ